MLAILYRVSFTGWKEDEDVVDQHSKSGYFSDIVDFDIQLTLSISNSQGTTKFVRDRESSR